MCKFVNVQIKRAPIMAVLLVKIKIQSKKSKMDPK